MKLLWTLLVGLTCAASALAADTGAALKNDTLKAEPYSDAKPVGAISRGEKLDVLEKNGAWLKVKSTKSQGWVRLLSVKRDAGGSSTAGVLALASGRAGTGKVVTTTGVRGLNEEELKAAQFSEPEIKALEANAVTADDAKAFAAAGQLVARKFEDLPAPQGGAQ